VTDANHSAANTKYGDPLTAPFWDAAERHELIIQRCKDCRHFQFYPRPFCLACGSEHVNWEKASGTGTIISQTTVRIEITPEWKPPYVVAIVKLSEGPTLLTNILNGECRIGDEVKVVWRKRPDAPPFPIFEPA
jgi:uncharacterized OB-fold protein